MTNLPFACMHIMNAVVEKWKMSATGCCAALPGIS